MKVFVSYSHHDRRLASELVEFLTAFGLDSFCAHDDIPVSQEWRDRILEELRSCRVLVALLSRAFTESQWAPQELGIAASRDGVLIVPLSIDGTIPLGFASHLQAERLGVNPSFHSVVRAIVLAFPDEMVPRLIDQIASSRSWRLSETLMALLEPYYDEFGDNEARALLKAATDNANVWNASACNQIYLPRLLQASSKRLPRRAVQVLRYQLREHKPFPRKGAA